MNLDQLNGLLALKVVADSQSFTAAARVFGVSSSAISQTISQLERRLGVALLFRTTRSTRLTEAGAQFLAQAGPALADILEALEAVGSYAQTPSGLLRLNLPRQFYRAFLAPVIASFSRKHPEITLELYFEDQQTDIVERGFDAGIRLSDILAKDMVALKLGGPVHFVTVAAPGYLDKAGHPKHPQDLLQHDCVRPRFNDYLYDKWEFAHKGKKIRVQVSGSLIMNDGLLALDAAVHGAGIVYTMEEGAVRALVQAGKLEVVLQNYADVSDGFYLYYPERRQVLPKLRAFIDHVKDYGAL